MWKRTAIFAEHQPEFRDGRGASEGVIILLPDLEAVVAELHPVMAIRFEADAQFTKPDLKAFSSKLFGRIISRNAGQVQR
ncbi:hypothetical protein AGMMS50248_03680 [Deltaproteobacteria bacterium]|nr:hypothetical protein AGMMS49925_04120 [Deltaproteobacteria bacterium]GHU97958.1 hypothetical protein AGMMS50248_03680 [Deltaproteobacteria bacterium]